ncbi:hypothetical protein [Hymenobacter sediminis]|nr:hypothetical protein [Hymenobacter sediminis]
MPTDRAKNGKAEHVAIMPQLAALIGNYGLRNYPSDHYIITKEQK